MTAPVREGDLLAGKYRVDKVLGVGGMGVVVAAHHVELDERVAIKFMLPQALANSEAVARFAREARAAVKIKSEHVARVSDVGRLESGAPFMVMEYLEGSDLSSWLTQRGALPVEQAVEFLLQAGEAVAEAHALGIVHRDLKPANLFVIRRADGVLSVKVLDFGISKMTSLMGTGGDGSMTKTSALMGSPLYMSPEQMQSSKGVDARGDIWALGVILYELVTGGPPFTADTMPELILKIMSGAPPLIRSARPDVPDGLEGVILRCLDKDRGKRWATVGELAVALQPFAPKRSRGSIERISGVMRAAGYSASALALPPSSDNQDPQPAGAGTAASWGRTTTRTGRGAWFAFAGVGILVAIAGSVVLAHKAPAAGGELASPGSSIAVLPVASNTAVEAVPPPPPSGTTMKGTGEASAAASTQPVSLDRLRVGLSGQAQRPSVGRQPVSTPSKAPGSTEPTNPPRASAAPPVVIPVAVAEAPPKPREQSPPPPSATPAAAPKPSMFEDRK